MSEDILHSEVYRKVVNRMKGVATGGEFNRVAILHNNVVVYSSSTACTGMLMNEAGYSFNRHNFGVGAKQAIFSMLCRVKEQEEHHLPFIDWLVKRSPYAQAFISKDAETIFEDKMFVTTPDCPSNILVGGLIASRGLWEYVHISKGWYELVKRGVNENLAFILAHKALLTPTTVSFTNRHDGHKAIDLVVDADYIKAFVHNNPVQLEEEYQTSNTYHNISGTWGGAVDGDVLEMLCVGVVYSKDDENNIFKNYLEPTGDTSIDVKEGFDQLAVIANKFFEEELL